MRIVGCSVVPAQYMGLDPRTAGRERRFAWSTRQDFVSKGVVEGRSKAA